MIASERERERKREKLRQELRDLIIRDFGMKHFLANNEVAGLLRELPELGLVPKPVKISKREEKAIRKAEHGELRKAADEFLEAVKERVDMYVLLHDLEGLDRLVTQIDIIGAYETVRAIRDKGFSKELTKLCDKVGRGKK